MESFRRGDGSPVELGNELSRGGEGIIYGVPSEPNSVAKIWREPNQLQARKLEILLRNPPTLPEGAWQRLELAWPTDALYDEQNVMRGYLMPRVPTDQFYELVRFCIPAARRTLESNRGTQFSRGELLIIARNLCETFNILHESGYVIGDVNHTNFLARPDGRVFVIDLDSVQATDPETGEVHRCTVGKEDFTPPRLMGQRFEDIDRTSDDDLFGLAVLVFQILMDGTHPYDPVDQSGGQGQVRQENIRRGYSPYVNLDVIQARAVLDLQNIPDPAIREQQRRNILALIGLGATADFDTVLGPRMSSWLELEPVFRDVFSTAFGEEQNSRPESQEWIAAVDSILLTLQPVAPAPAPAATPSPPVATTAAAAAFPGMRSAPPAGTPPPRANPPPRPAAAGAGPPAAPAGQYFASASGGGSGRWKFFVGIPVSVAIVVVIAILFLPGGDGGAAAAGTPDWTPTPVVIATPTRIPVSTEAPTDTPVPPTPTQTPRSTLVPTPTYTPKPPPTRTPTPTPVVVRRPTPTFTPTPTHRPTPTFTPTPTHRPTPTFTPTPTRPPRPTFTPTPTPSPWVWYTRENSRYKYTFDYERSWELTDGTRARGRPFVNITVKNFNSGESIAGFFERHRGELLSKAPTYAAFEPGLTKGETANLRNYIHMEYLWQPTASDCLYHVVEHVFRSRFYPLRDYGFIVAAGVCEDQVSHYARPRLHILSSFEETE